MFLKYISMYQIALSECKVQHTKKRKLIVLQVLVTKLFIGETIKFHQISSLECVTKALAVLIAVKIT